MEESSRNNDVKWPNQMYVQPKPFLVTMMISSSPFLATIVIIFFVFAVLTRLFTFVRYKQHMRQAKDQMMMQNYLELVTYGRNDFTDNQKTFEEIIRHVNIRPNENRFRAKFKKSLADFHLPDEDKCPIELVNDVIARNKYSVSNGLQMIVNPNNDPNLEMGVNRNKVEIDDEVIQIINNLIRPEIPNDVTQRRDSFENAGNMSRSNSMKMMARKRGNSKRPSIGEKENQDSTKVDEPKPGGDAAPAPPRVPPPIKIIIEDYDGAN